MSNFTFKDALDYNILPSNGTYESMAWVDALNSSNANSNPL